MTTQLDTPALEQACLLLDGVYRYWLDADADDPAVFALHEVAEIQTELMRHAGLDYLPAQPAVSPPPALSAAAHLIRGVAEHGDAHVRLVLLGHELRLRRIADRVQR